MRRTILIVSNSLFYLACGLWLGAIVGVRALFSPVAFNALQLGQPAGSAPWAGAVLADGLKRLDTFSLLMMIAALSVVTFELFYRQRTTVRRLLLARWVAVIAAFLVALYLTIRVVPNMSGHLEPGDIVAFRGLYARHGLWSLVQALIGVVVIIQTCAINIGPRRDGGHPRSGAEASAPESEGSAIW